MSFAFSAIGTIHSPFREKFGIPRQPGLVPDARVSLELLAPYDRDEALRGIENFSHLWLLFVFHACAKAGWRPTVRPPRLGGNRRIGVFATRSTFRPNPIGMSVVKLEGTQRKGAKLMLHLSGADLLDQTPVLDIKPYLPWADAPAQASAGFAQQPPSALPVEFSPQALAACQKKEESDYPRFRHLVVEMLQVDPRPAYGCKPGKRFGFRLLDVEVHWCLEGGRIRVLSIEASSALDDCRFFSAISSL
jgi:tRNA-Thr(GGU) m(6)t(6)A37 methyltransferase TsaA